MVGGEVGDRMDFVMFLLTLVRTITVFVAAFSLFMAAATWDLAWLGTCLSQVVVYVGATALFHYLCVREERKSRGR